MNKFNLILLSLVLVILTGLVLHFSHPVRETCEPELTGNTYKDLLMVVGDN